MGRKLFGVPDHDATGMTYDASPAVAVAEPDVLSGDLTRASVSGHRPGLSTHFRHAMQTGVVITSADLSLSRAGALHAMAGLCVAVLVVALLLRQIPTSTEGLSECQDAGPERRPCLPVAVTATHLL